MDPFERRVPIPEKLLAYGFERRGDGYVVTRPIVDGEFLVTVEVGGGVKTTTLECATGEPYVLHLVEAAQGTFVGQVRAEYSALLAEIAARCFSADFGGAAARKTYGAEPEFLWEKFPEDAVLRRKDTGKWFGALLTVAENKLGRQGGANIAILDVRATEEEIAALSDGVRYFPGYHMNKRHWLTAVLDGSIPHEELMQRIALSYERAK